MSWSDNFAFYLQPLSEDVLAARYPKEALGSLINTHSAAGFPDLVDVQVAVVGVLEDRRSDDNKGCATGADEIRKHLYRLFLPHPQLKIADLGNVAAGETVEDTEAAVKQIVSQLLLHNVLTIIIGGSHDLAYAVYSAYEKLETTVNMVDIDSRIDLDENPEKVNSRNYLYRIILHKPNYLFNFSNIGYQTYLVPPTMLSLMDKLYFDTYRLGLMAADITETEPVLRDADVVSIDIGAMKMSEAPGQAFPMPNGFYNEQVCQMCRYAGLSDKLSCLGFYEYNPQMDFQGQTAAGIAQMIWAALDGFSQRKKEFPVKAKQEFVEYRVAGIKDESDMIFYKSKRSDRWWMKIPYNVGPTQRYERHHIVACSYKDYQKACNQEVPDKWWQTYQKLI